MTRNERENLLFLHLPSHSNVTTPLFPFRLLSGPGPSPPSPPPAPLSPGSRRDHSTCAGVESRGHQTHQGPTCLSDPVSRVPVFQEQSLLGPTDTSLKRRRVGRTTPCRPDPGKEPNVEKVQYCNRVTRVECVTLPVPRSLCRPVTQ